MSGAPHATLYHMELIFRVAEQWFQGLKTCT